MNTLTNKITFSVVGAVLGIVCTVPVAMGGDLAIPKSWVADERLTATELNSNFQATEAAVDGNAVDIGTNTSDISTNSNNISSNAGRITSNGTMISNIPPASGISYLNNNSGSACHLLTTSVTNTASTVLTAPADGFVFVTFSAYTYIVHSATVYDRFKIGLSKSSAAAITDSVRLMSVSASAPADTYYSSIGSQQVYPVLSGTTTTFYANAQIQFGASQRLCHFNLTAIFVPKLYQP